MPIPKLGIAISKEHFDVAFQWQAEQVRPKQGQYLKSPAGFEQLAQWLVGQGASQGHAVMEATGSSGLPRRVSWCSKARASPLSRLRA